MNDYCIYYIIVGRDGTELRKSHIVAANMHLALGAFDNNCINLKIKPFIIRCELVYASTS